MEGYYPLATLDLNGDRARIRTPRRGEFNIATFPTHARAAIPPEGDFDPLDLAVLRSDLPSEIEGRARVGRFPETKIHAALKLFARYGF